MCLYLGGDGCVAAGFAVKFVCVNVLHAHCTCTCTCTCTGQWPLTTSGALSATSFSPAPAALACCSPGLGASSGGSHFFLTRLRLRANAAASSSSCRRRLAGCPRSMFGPTRGNCICSHRPGQCQPAAGKLRRHLSYILFPTLLELPCTRPRCVAGPPPLKVGKYVSWRTTHLPRHAKSLACIPSQRSRQRLRRPWRTEILHTRARVIMPFP